MTYAKYAFHFQINYSRLLALAKTGLESENTSLDERVSIDVTNVSKELAPYDEDWYFIRCASIARHIYIRSPIGVSTVCKIYGVRRNNGTKPSHWSAGSGTVARKCLQVRINIRRRWKLEHLCRRQLSFLSAMTLSFCN